jgi:hypothetical protein
MKIGALASIGIALLLTPLPAQAHHGGGGVRVVIRVVPVTRAPGARTLLSVNRFALRGTGFTVNNGLVPPLIRPTIPVTVTNTPGLRSISFDGTTTGFVDHGNVASHSRMVTFDTTTGFTTTGFVDHENVASHSRTVTFDTTTVPSGSVAVIRGTGVTFVTLASSD